VAKGPGIDLTRVAAVLAANPACADCGAAKPDWASISLGVVVCIECSGVHRSLGAHISKVRSLTLDALPSNVYSIFDGLGNDRANACYEAGVAQGWNKPKADAARETKEQWIRAKYQFKGFAAFDEAVHANGEDAATAHYSALLYAAAAAGDLAGAQAALALGADVAAAIGKHDGRSPLHAAAAAGRVVMAEYLCQNGAHVDQHDGLHCSAIDAAMCASQREMVSLLNARLPEGKKR